MDSLPEEYREPIKAIVHRMRQFMRNGEELSAMAFLGKRNKGFMPIPLDTGSGISKDASAAMVTAIADMLKPDYAILVSEGYTLPQSIPSEEQLELVKKYGSVQACPGAVEIVFMTVETLNGVWIARQPILNLQGKARGFEDFRFERSDCSSGRFSNFLTPAAKTIH